MREGLSSLDEFDTTTCKAVDVANFRSRLRDFVLNTVHGILVERSKND